MSDFLKNRNFQLGILITLACLVVLLISLNHKSMGFEIAILAVIAVILLTTYLVMHILGSNDSDAAAGTTARFTDYKEDFDCGKKHNNNEVQENFANPVEDYQNTEHFDDHDMWTVVNQKDLRNPDFIKLLPTDQSGNPVGSLISESNVNKTGLIPVVKGTTIQVRKQNLLTGQSEGSALRGTVPAKDTNQIGGIDYNQVQNILGAKEGDPDRDYNNIIFDEDKKKKLAARRLKAASASVVRDQRADVVAGDLNGNDKPDDSLSCGGAAGDQVCLFEISTRDTCINRNSYDIRGTCHIENQGPLPAPQPPKCPCDSQTSDKWNAHMSKTLGYNGEDCNSTNVQDKSDQLWAAQYDEMYKTAGKEDKDNCWKEENALDNNPMWLKQARAAGAARKAEPFNNLMPNDLMPANKA